MNNINFRWLDCSKHDLHDTLLTVPIRSDGVFQNFETRAERLDSMHGSRFLSSPPVVQLPLLTLEFFWRLLTLENKTSYKRQTIKLTMNTSNLILP